MSKFRLSAFADEIDSDLNTQMDVLEQHDIKYIEMRGVNGKLLLHHSLEEAKELRNRLMIEGLKFSNWISTWKD
ncbi:hypothetical protein [Lederbergia ruris]|uniref:Uncharacterized protein n=1 Tax=Lederbergia ruris TaxID=217495 RepID=A0ABQ4KDL6_9BACI|nr:hypothetical protein [Lederbergia ruris]GIN56067.1 hypothetical protein J8TS2_03860 [Lederbergia ruris]